SPLRARQSGSAVSYQAQTGRGPGAPSGAGPHPLSGGSGRLVLWRGSRGQARVARPEGGLRVGAQTFACVVASRWSDWLAPASDRSLQPNLTLVHKVPIKHFLNVTPTRVSYE